MARRQYRLRYRRLLRLSIRNKKIRTLAKVMPENACLSRIGGDEYVVLIPIGNEDMAQAFVTNVKAEFAKIHNEGYGSPSVSWGYAVMETADAMMDRDKRENAEVFRSSSLIGVDQGMERGI